MALFSNSVEHHGENPRQNVIAIIPARFASVRLPGKLLLQIGGKPLILHTLAQAAKARTVDRVIVATDDERIFRVVIEGGGEAVMTSAEHASGSDRIAEVARDLPEGSIIVNVQGDEPMISPETIDRAVREIANFDSASPPRPPKAASTPPKTGGELSEPPALARGFLKAMSVTTPSAEAAAPPETGRELRADIVTTCEPITDMDDLFNGNIVKVVYGDDGFALYFSRSPMPFPRDASLRYEGDPNAAIRNEPDLLSIFRKHTGLYVYSREFLLEFTKLPHSKLEKIEMLEQLRALENGARIKVVQTASRSVGVDTQEDFEKVKQILERSKITYREATEEDIPDVARVHVESWKKSFEDIVPGEFLDHLSVEKRTERFRKAFEQRHDPKSFYRIFVAEDSERGIVGFADFGLPRDDSASDVDLYAIYFLPEFQRKGIGGRLFRLCQQTMVKHGFRSMSLDSLEVSPYRKFYEKMGGKAVGSGSHDLGGVEYKTVFYGWDDIEK